jgi:hypothetical protein
MRPSSRYYQGCCLEAIPQLDAQSWVISIEKRLTVDNFVTSSATLLVSAPRHLKKRGVLLTTDRLIPYTHLHFVSKQMFHGYNAHATK